MIKHTPGEWKVWTIEVGEEALRTLEFLKDYEPRPRNATNGLRQVIAKAKAHLIASAPELLEAYEEALRTLEFLKDYEPRPRNATNGLRQVIAKAKGGSK